MLNHRVSAFLHFGYIPQSPDELPWGLRELVARQSDEGASGTHLPGLGVPRRYRKNQFLHKEILKHAYPVPFSLPGKTSMGLALTASRWRRVCHLQYLGACTLRRKLFGDRGSIDPRLNYIDFAAAIRTRDDIRNVVTANIRDLEERRILKWLDMESLLRRHLDGTVDHADALLVLTSLEIHLKTGRIVPAD